MRIVAIIGAGAALVCLAGSAQAARWCSGSGECGFRSQSQCVRAMGAAGGCHKPIAARAAAPSDYYQGPAPITSAGPAWRSPYECYSDEGYGRYTPCSGGGGGRN